MSGFLDAPAPRWFTIPAHRPFLSDLADGVWRALGPLGDEMLSRAVILVPNRRAARSLAEAFLAAAPGRALLPPLIRALGDLDDDEAPLELAKDALELPLAISPRRRRFELAALAARHAGKIDRRLDAGAALDLADALGRLLDSLAIEGRAWPNDSTGLAPPDLAAHWLKSAAFLDAVLSDWRDRLDALGLMDEAARRVAVTRRWIQRLETTRGGEVMIAAGSTGSTPATADLLAAIARSPRGCVVLPGLDLSLAEKAWLEVARDDQHPQGALSRLLAGAGVARCEVRHWDGAAEGEMAGRWRRRLVNEALRPPDATADWLKVICDLKHEAPEAGSLARGLEGLSVIRARNEDEAAAAAALLLREALEAPGRTATLVTPDAALARRVQARLTRWGVTADSSVGETLAGTPAAVLAALVTRHGHAPADPVVLLAIVKHPLTRLGLDERDLARARERLERDALRGIPPRDWTEIDQRLRGDGGEAKGAGAEAAIDLAQRLRAALAPASAAFADGAATAAAAAAGVVRALEALAGNPDGGGGEEIWRGQAGAALGEALASLMDDSGALPKVTRQGFAELLEGLLSRVPVRPGGATHPRLAIMGVLEARLTRPDLMILAGLEEGLWPAGASIDPFLARPMREALGLPSPERRIGLAAHDFAQAACAPEVVLLHTERRDGAPTVKSRWLWRLEALLRGAGLALPERMDTLRWARALDAPLAQPPPHLRPALRPAPRPPVAARPRQLSVTAVETWIRDPYAIYGRRVLRLPALERPGAEADARTRGIAVHAAFQRFTQTWPRDLPPDPEARFETLLLEELETGGMPAERMVRERALAANTARWVIEFERRRRPGARLLVEQSGQMTLEAAGGPFVLTARADRIEDRGASADVLDFKTGAPPSQKQVDTIMAPQLTLTAAILAAGGFAELGPRTPGELLYVRVSGGRVPGDEAARDGGDAPGMAAAALAWLAGQVDRFDDPSTPYTSWTAPQYISRFGGDYDALARLWEWRVMGEDEAEGEA